MDKFCPRSNQIKRKLAQHESCTLNKEYIVLRRLTKLKC